MKMDEKKSYETVNVAVITLECDDVVATSKPFFGEVDPVKMTVNSDSYAL